MRIRRILRWMSLVLGTGYVVYFFSERMFWSLWRPADDFGESVIIWLVYSFLAYVLLATIRCFRVRSLRALFLAGAVYGWVNEGVFTMTMFGDSGLEFPFTVPWTGLAWHALITVVIAWYALRLALQEASPRSSLLLSLGFGLFWGFWSVAWGNETPPIRAEPLDFFLHAMLTTGGLLVGQWLTTAGDPASFQPSRFGLVVATAVVSGYFVFVTVATIPPALLILPPLFALIFVALRKNRARESRPDVLEQMAVPVPARNLAGLFVMPLAATAVYSALNASGLLLPSHQIVCFITSVAGFILFIMALFKILFRGEPRLTMGAADPLRGHSI